MSVSFRKLWLEYVGPTGLCGLCGNIGVVDTRGRINEGVRRWCICPVGRAWRRVAGRQMVDTDPMPEAAPLDGGT